MSRFFDSPIRERDPDRVRAFRLIESAGDNVKALAAARAEIATLQRQIANQRSQFRSWVSDKETIIALRLELKRRAIPHAETWRATVLRLLSDFDDADVLTVADLDFLEGLEPLKQIDSRRLRKLKGIAERFDTAP